jgi:hypothetical protein
VLMFLSCVLILVAANQMKCKDVRRSERSKPSGSWKASRAVWRAAGKSGGTVKVRVATPADLPSPPEGAAPDLDELENQIQVYETVGTARRQGSVRVETVPPPRIPAAVLATFRQVTSEEQQE